MFSSPQENANQAWAELGRRMGFDPMTVQPVEGKNTRFFTAVPSETEGQRVARLDRKAEQARVAEISRLKDEINARQKRLSELESEQPR